MLLIPSPFVNQLITKLKIILWFFRSFSFFVSVLSSYGKIIDKLNHDYWSKSNVNIRISGLCKQRTGTKHLYRSIGSYHRNGRYETLVRTDRFQTNLESIFNWKQLILISLFYFILFKKNQIIQLHSNSLIQLHHWFRLSCVHWCSIPIRLN